MASRDAMHRTILVVDIEQSNHPMRTNSDQLVIRNAMYQSLAVAFRRNDWLKCHTEDRGDGVLILVPPEVPKIRLVTSLLDRLVTALDRHNAAIERQDPVRAAATQIRLRVAVHAGEVTHDDHGVVGAAITHTFRMADAPPMKAAFAASPGVCALIVSDWFYSEVVHHYPDARPDRFRRIDCAVKETRLSAWIRVPYQPQAGTEPAGTEPAGAANGAQAPERRSIVRIPAQLAGFRAIDVTSPPWPQQSPELGQPAGRTTAAVPPTGGRRPAHEPTATH